MNTGWTVDWTGNGVDDIVTKWDDGGLRLYKGHSGGGFASSQSIGVGWQGMQIAPSRFDKSDALPGLLAKDSSGRLWNYTNTSGGALTTNGRTQIGQGWGDLQHLPFDFNGDGNQDVLGISSANAMRLYKGNGAGGWIGSGAQIGSGWSFVSVASSPRGSPARAPEACMPRHPTVSCTITPSTAPGSSEHAP